jgi:hypothetical protein
MLALLAVAAALAAPVPVSALPDTTARTAVFSDQLPQLSPALARFAATHYAGAQKLTHSQTAQLKAVNPRFFMVQYRLALGLGYRTAGSGCAATGDWISIIFGDNWTREYPAHPRESWFFHRGGQRVYSCANGWYLMNPDDPSWRTYYTRELRRQLVGSGADGAFLDSASVPNFFGGSSFKPPLPDLDPPFERAWTTRLERWLSFVRTRVGYPIVANAGSLITTRDHTDYSHIDGVMVEGFGDVSYAPGDWALDVGRTLALSRLGRIVICQTYPEDADARMYALASYLLVRGKHTYVNFPTGIAISWWPEYDVDLGAPAAALPRSLDAYKQGSVYVRRFRNGLVVVNPADAAASFPLDRAYRRVTANGGGEVPADGRPPAAWGLGTAAVSGALDLPPHRAAILLR